MKFYVVKNRDFDFYFREKQDEDDWIITFDRDRATTFDSFVDAEMVAIEFGVDAIVEPLKKVRKSVAGERQR